MVTKPIQVQLRHDQVSARARALLKKLEADALTQRQIKLQATKASLAVGKMLSVAEPSLAKMSNYQRDRLVRELQAIEARLRELSIRGL